MAKLLISKYEAMSEIDMESRFECFEYSNRGIFLCFEIESLNSGPLFLSAPNSLSAKNLSVRVIRHLGDYNELDDPPFEDTSAVITQIYQQIFQDIPKIVSDTHDQRPLLLSLTLQLLASVAEKVQQL